MKPITHAANGSEYLLVEVPEGAMDFTLSNVDDDPTQECELEYLGPNPDYVDDGEETVHDEICILNEWLPAGNYTIIGLTNELSEDDAANIIGRYQGNPYKYSCYENGKVIPNYWCETAYLSLHSLTRSHGMNNPLILQKI